jgi:hypothetical protein
VEEGRLEEWKIWKGRSVETFQPSKSSYLPSSLRQIKDLAHKKLVRIRQTIGRGQGFGAGPIKPGN